MTDAIKRNTILNGPFWPGPVRVLSAETLDDDLFTLEVVEVNTGAFHSGVTLTGEDLAQVVIQEPTHLDFSGDPHRFHLAIEAERFRLAHDHDPHFAVNVSSITPLPHQLDAVYRYMLQAPEVRFLLADDPGAGKTIMSGLLIKELRFRSLADRVLILVPPLVAKNWQEELELKFSERFEIINRDVIKNAAGRNPWLETDRVITSVYWAGRKDIMPALLEAEWDLVIVDEAHKMAAYRRGSRKVKIERTFLYRLGENISARARQLLLLTATPHKGDSGNFQMLLQLLDKDLFSDARSIRDAVRREENPIMVRRLKEEMRLFDGSPLFPPRTVKTVEFDLSPLESALYEGVTEYVTDHFNRAETQKRRNVGFAMSVLQRRLTSSVPALRLSLERRLARLEELHEKALSLENPDLNEDIPEEDLGNAERMHLEEDMMERLTSSQNLEELETELTALRQLIRQARDVEGQGLESKTRKLLDSLLRDQGLVEKGEKLLIFTESSDTLKYLVKILADQGLIVAVIEGSLSMNKRIAQQELFRGEAQVLVATEAGSESINLQFCNQMVNFDIPWNPNRLEQRMGRIHRIGQENEVFIFNLVAVNTREGQVLGALSRKMDLMAEELGSDLVFDMISERLDEANISLPDLILECVTNRRRLDETLRTVEETFTPESMAILKEAREKGLAHRGVNLPRLRGEAVLSKGRALLPNHLRGFFEQVFQSLDGGRMTRPTPQTIRVDRVPLSLRRDSDRVFRRKYGLVAREYRELSFESSDSAERLGPGHPLFTAMMDHLSGDANLRKGAVFLDASITRPQRLWFLRITIADGAAAVLTRRLAAVREDENGDFHETGPLLLHDLSPAPNSGAPILEDYDQRAKKAATFCFQGRARQLAYEQKATRDRDCDLKKTYLERSFNAAIARHNETLLDLERAGAAENQIRNEQRALDELRLRRDGRLQTLARERQVNARLPEVIGVAQLLPHSEPAPTYADDDLIIRVATAEAAHGRILEDTRGEYAGYDAISRDENGQHARFILARRPDKAQQVALTALEHQIFEHLCDDMMLYVDLDEGLQLFHRHDLTIQGDAKHRRAWISYPQTPE